MKIGDLVTVEDYNGTWEILGFPFDGGVVLKPTSAAQISGTVSWSSLIVEKRRVRPMNVQSPDAACTCGATKVGSTHHSHWCDLGVPS